MKSFLKTETHSKLNLNRSSFLPQSLLFTGDSVTLRCEVDQSWDGLEFIWSKNSNTESAEAATKTIDSLKVSDGGEYRCRARRGEYYTHYSEPVTVTILYSKNTYSVLLLSLSQVNTPVMEKREEDHEHQTSVMQLH
uniref:Ig-like domain-containing protein n=1 Tax=Sinocyclocheilus anshuiensis TaxID=1608454 RepID=A0A671KN99_9TELE